MNDPQPLKPERTLNASGLALSSKGYALLLIVHILAGLFLLVLLVEVVSKYWVTFVLLHEKGNAQDLTEFVARASPYLAWLLPLGLAVDAAVLYVLCRLPRKKRWLVIAWFSLVLVCLLALDIMTSIGILELLVRMENWG